MVHCSTMLSATTAALLSLIFSNVSDAFSISQRRPPRSPSALFSSPPKKKTKKQSSQVAVDDLDEKPAGIGGAEFFGGNKQKEEFYDPVAEARADVEVEDAAYNKFRDLGAFADAQVASVARSLQAQLNYVLYEGSAEPQGISKLLEYAPALKWETVVRGTSLGNGKFELNWKLSVCWPTFWEPRILLLGGSVVTVNEQNQITEQVNTLSDFKDLLSLVSSQIWPRFWDMYHIGMTPVSEKVQEKVVKKSFDGSYKVVDLPARLLSVPSRLDTGVGREERNAQTSQLGIAHPRRGPRGRAGIRPAVPIRVCKEAPHRHPGVRQGTPGRRRVRQAQGTLREGVERRIQTQVGRRRAPPIHPSQPRSQDVLRRRRRARHGGLRRAEFAKTNEIGIELEM